MASILSKIQRTLEKEGVTGVLHRAAKRVYRRDEMIFLKRPLEDGVAVPFLPHSPVTTRFIEEDRLPLLEPHMPPENMELYRDRLRQGMKLLVVLTPAEDTVLGWVWSTDKTFYDAYDHATYHTLPSHVQHFDGQVVPQKRGRGFAFVGFPLMWHHWHRRGFRQSVCVISTKNRPSLRTHQRLGYTEIGRMTMHWCLGHRWITTDTEFVSSGDKTRRG